MRILITAVLFLLLAVPMAADAGMHMSANDKRILNSLTPEARKEVLSRLTPGETVQGIVEVMVLNNLSRLYEQGRLQVNVIEEVATVTYPDGRKETVKFDIDEIVIKD